MIFYYSNEVHIALNKVYTCYYPRTVYSDSRHMFRKQALHGDMLKCMWKYVIQHIIKSFWYGRDLYSSKYL